MNLVQVRIFSILFQAFCAAGLLVAIAQDVSAKEGENQQQLEALVHVCDKTHQEALHQMRERYPLFQQWFDSKTRTLEETQLFTQNMIDAAAAKKLATPAKGIVVDSAYRRIRDGLDLPRNRELEIASRGIREEILLPAQFTRKKYIKPIYERPFVTPQVLRTAVNKLSFEDWAHYEDNLKIWHDALKTLQNQNELSEVFSQIAWTSSSDVIYVNSDYRVLEWLQHHLGSDGPIWVTRSKPREAEGRLFDCFQIDVASSYSYSFEIMDLSSSMPLTHWRFGQAQDRHSNFLRIFPKKFDGALPNQAGPETKIEDIDVLKLLRGEVVGPLSAVHRWSNAFYEAYPGFEPTILRPTRSLHWHNFFRNVEALSHQTGWNEYFYDNTRLIIPDSNTLVFDGSREMFRTKTTAFENFGNVEMILMPTVAFEVEYSARFPLRKIPRTHLATLPDWGARSNVQVQSQLSEHWAALKIGQKNSDSPLNPDVGFLAEIFTYARTLPREATIYTEDSGIWTPLMNVALSPERKFVSPFGRTEVHFSGWTRKDRFAFANWTITQKGPVFVTVHLVHNVHGSTQEKLEAQFSPKYFGRPHP